MTRPIAAAFAVIGFIALSGCSVFGSAAPRTPKPTPPPPPAVTPAPVASAPAPKQSASPLQPRHYRIPLTADYRSFLAGICNALTSRNAQPIINDLPYYQYDSGVYYGPFNRGEGQTGQPSLINQWLQSGSESCVRFAPSQMGHGAVVTKGWPVTGGWAILDLDRFNGAWKIDDFTFGTRWQAMYALTSTEPETVWYSHAAVG
ncbi:MAG TPA: hypothetical protein VFB34_11680 [Chloroflexota bacterium]|nr:hypothetical protein [Chloroflexota bacterium]